MRPTIRFDFGDAILGAFSRVAFDEPNGILGPERIEPVPGPEAGDPGSNRYGAAGRAGLETARQAGRVAN